MNQRALYERPKKYYCAILLNIAKPVSRSSVTSSQPSLPNFFKSISRIALLFCFSVNESSAFSHFRNRRSLFKIIHNFVSTISL